MKRENLKLGKTYYYPVANNPSRCHFGVLLGTTRKYAFLKNLEDEVVTCKMSMLHRTPNKAVVGKYAKMNIGRETKSEKRKAEESLVNAELQQKVKILGHSTYATMKHEKYVICGYIGSHSFDTETQVERWAEQELEKLEIRKQRITAYNYKLLKYVSKDGMAHYYSITGISFEKFEIYCEMTHQDIDTIDPNEILNRNEVKDFKMIFKAKPKRKRRISQRRK